MSSVDVQKLREAIKRDLELIQEFELELARLASEVFTTARKNLDRLKEGRRMGEAQVFFSSDLDAAASKLARRIDHYQALVEVAYLAEGGEL